MDTSYLKLPHYPVKDKNDFYKSGVVGASNIRNLITTARRVFQVPDKSINLGVVGDDGVYLIEVYQGMASSRVLVGRLYYIPATRRLDIYEGNSGTPLIGWKGRKIVMKNYSVMLEALGMETLFRPLSILI